MKQTLGIISPAVKISPKGRKEKGEISKAGILWIKAFFTSQTQLLGRDKARKAKRKRILSLPTGLALVSMLLSKIDGLILAFIAQRGAAYGGRKSKKKLSRISSPKISAL